MASSMPDRGGNIQPGTYPLTTWRTRPGVDVRHWAPYLPEITIMAGRDDHSAGLTITAWEPTQGEFAAYRTLYAVRWKDAATSTQEALEVCYRGIAAALAELFGVEVD